MIEVMSRRFGELRVRDYLKIENNITICLENGTCFE